MSEINVEKLEELIDLMENNIDDNEDEDIEIVISDFNAEDFILNNEYRIKEFFENFLESNLFDDSYIDNNIGDLNNIKNFSYEEYLVLLTKIIREYKQNNKQLLLECINNGTFLEILRQILINIQPKSSIKDITIASEITNIINISEYGNHLFIPVLDGLVEQKSDEPQNLLIATCDGLVEQLVCDGDMGEELFIDRINNIINNTKKFMEENGCENVDNSFAFYKDYSNGIFNFKVYIQDLIIPTSEEIKKFRTFIAFFVDPETNAFYQLSIGAGPFAYSDEQLKLGEFDLNNDMVTIGLNDSLNVLMDNIKYISQE